MLHSKLSKMMNRFAEWRIRHIGNDTFVILAAFVVGTVTSLAAVLLKVTVHEIKYLVETLIYLHQSEWLYFIYPLLGILLCTIYVQVFRKGELGRGIGLVLVSILKKNANVEKHKMSSQMISSVLTVGFGGSAGLEAPIVVTGSAFGSRIGNAFRMNIKEKTLLIACGAAAGISAIFNCPVAGVIFALEVVLAQATVPAFIPVLIASATSAVVSKIIYKGQPFFRITDEWPVADIPLFIVLGLISGLMSVYCIRTYLKSEQLFIKRKKPYQNTIICGVLLGGLTFLFPPLYGEGYNNILELFTGNYSALMAYSPFANYISGDYFFLLLAIVLMFTKVLATGLTIGGGGNGGMFGTSLYSGAFMGFAFSEIVNMTGIASTNPAHFIAIGMAGLLSGVIHAPMTAIFLIAEITGGYTLFVPLMIVSALSYFICKYFETYSVYTKKLALAGELYVNDKDKIVLEKIELSSLVENDFAEVSISSNLGHLVEVIGRSKRNIFPVTDQHHYLHGIILLDDIRHVMFQQEKYTTTGVKDLMIQPPAILMMNEKMSDVMKKFVDTNAWNLPVLENNRYKGFVSKSSIFTRYRDLLIEEQSE